MKEIKDYPGYHITEDGRVWSDITNRYLKPENRKQYLSVLLYKQRKAHHAPIHRLVALAYVDGYEEGLVVNHKDGNKHNNKHDNLEWVTISENTRHGQRLHPDYHFKGSMKLTDVVINAIREEASIMSQQALADKYNISQSTISRILLRQLSY